MRVPAALHINLSPFDRVLTVLGFSFTAGAIVQFSIGASTTLATVLLSLGPTAMVAAIYAAHERSQQERSAAELKKKLDASTLPNVRTAVRLGSLLSKSTRFPALPTAHYQELLQLGRWLGLETVATFVGGWKPIPPEAILTEMEAIHPDSIVAAFRVGKALRELADGSETIDRASMDQDLETLGCDLTLQHFVDAHLFAPERYSSTAREALADIVSVQLYNLQTKVGDQLLSAILRLRDETEALALRQLVQHSPLKAAEDELEPVVPASLPESLQKKNILARMTNGERKWAVPWAMAVTPDGRCYLNGSYDTAKSPGGTVSMLVERLEGGFRVTVPKGELFERSLDLPWMGARPSNLIPVVEIRVFASNDRSGVGAEVPEGSQSAARSAQTGTTRATAPPVPSSVQFQYVFDTEIDPNIRVFRNVWAHRQDLLQLAAEYPGILNGSIWIDCYLDDTDWPPFIHDVTLIDTHLRDSRWHLECGENIRIIGTMTVPVTEEELETSDCAARVDRMQMTGYLKGLTIVSVAGPNVIFGSPS